MGLTPDGDLTLTPFIPLREELVNPGVLVSLFVAVSGLVIVLGGVCLRVAQARAEGAAAHQTGEVGRRLTGCMKGASVT